MRICEFPIKCYNVVWGTDRITGKGYCKQHQWARTDKKNKPKKVYEIKKTPKADNTEQVLMNSIISTRRHVSFISGQNIDTVDGITTYVNCAHVLAKGQNKYPAFKLFDRNIVLLTKEEHHLFDHGTIEQREKYRLLMWEQNDVIVHWEKIFTLAEILKDEYKKNNYGK